ncbi:MAG: DUF559 domain-containing protein [Armatimonadetes bacterium]|nr:DUF559 domain-containing protein [Armatimonadota bacterium]
MDGRPKQSDHQTRRARLLRQEAIRAEKRLWYLFKAGNKSDFKIRRQHPIGPFIVDFFCFSAKLALEIDGWSHVGCEAQDAARDAYLSKMGIKTIRVGPSVADEGINEFVEWFREECRKRAKELA